MISIIIPVFNGAEWLAEAIDSALSQRGEELPEVIVVNDGSTDDSLSIAKNYEPTIKIISQINKGLASARNTGIMNAKGRYCLFLDADDKLLPLAVRKIEEKIPQLIDILTGDERSPDIIAPSFKEFGLGNRDIILMDNPKLEDFKTGNRLGYCAAIRKSALLEVGGYSPKMVEGYEDLHLWINLLTKGFKIRTIPDILWMYRIKKESMYTKITPEIHTKLIGQINKDFPEAKLNF